MADAPPSRSAPPSRGEPTVTFSLDGRPATARPGEMIISAAERAGTYIPRFCYHPRMKPVGMCRMCLVEVSGPRGATLQPACFLAVTEGMEVVTTSPHVKKAQDGVLEFLLVNHPLDCPVCDKGGECPLQDQTLAYGPGESRFVEEKRHFEKPVAISELVLLDRERCIQCGRCTRFAAEVAGEAQIDFAGRGERVEVATFPARPFTSYFSGNTVQICPVGALTATPYRFTARPWDLEQVESTCTTCALGCRVAVQSSANRVTRLLGIDADPVNQGWLCDKGRFAYEAVNGEGPAPGERAAPREGAEYARWAASGPVPAARGRVTQPMVRKDGRLVPVGWSEALAAAASRLAAARDQAGPETVAFLGGAQLTNEGAYAWAKLAKGVVGTDSVDAQLGDGLPAELVLGLPRATIDDACSARVVVLLSGDVREELPVLFLRLRAAVCSGGTRLVELAQRPSALTPYAAVSVPVGPGEAPALARALTGDGGPVPGAGSGAGSGRGGAPGDPLAEARGLLGTAPGGGSAGEGVVVVLGRPSLAESADVVAEFATVIAAAWPGARFLPALRRGNVHGALDMGLAPGLLPGRVSLGAGREWYAAAWPTVPAAPGLDAAGVLASLAGEDADRAGSARVRALVLVGADPLGDFPDRQLAERALAGAESVIVVAGHTSESSERADVVLPAAVAHERPGTATNVEGRVTRLAQKLVPPGTVWADWMIAAELAAALGADLGFTSLTGLWDELERLAPAYRGLGARLAGPAARDGLVVPLDASSAGEDGMRRRFLPVDPMAVPGVDAVEQQGAPPRIGLTAAPPFEAWTSSGDRPAPGAPSLPPVPGTPAEPSPGMPPVLGGTPPAPPTRRAQVPPAGPGTLRLVAGRRLYDSGHAVLGSPSLGALVERATVRAHPAVLEPLGVAAGELVRVRSARGSLVLPATPDATLSRAVVAVDFNVPAAGAGPANAVAVLIDAGAPVTDVVLEAP